MVESIKKLKIICQKRTEKESLYVRFVIRKLSIYLTKLFLYTPLTPNQITVLGLILGLVAAFYLSNGEYFLSLIGALLLFLAHIFDYVDGEIARYKKKSSLIGDYLDNACTDIVLITAFVGLTFAVYKIFQNTLIFLLGFLIIISYSEFRVVIWHRFNVLFHVLERKNNIKKQNKTDKKLGFLGKFMFLLKKIDVCSKIFSNPIIVFFILIGSVLNILYLIFFFYAFTFPLFTFSHIVYQLFGGLDNFIKDNILSLKKEKHVD